MHNYSCNLYDPNLKIKVALGSNVNPFEWLDPIGSKPMGFAYKQLELLHKVYGISMEYKWYDSALAGYCSSISNCSGLLDNLLSGYVDMLAPHVSIDEERLQYASFR